MAMLREIRPRLPFIANTISMTTLVGMFLVKATPPRQLLPNLTLSGWMVLGLGLGLWAFHEASEASYPGAVENVVESPQKTLPSTSSEIASLSYPPDVLPGARDVNSPYGSLRVYEWGPVEGRKVLFIHGISTPSIAFGKWLVGNSNCMAIKKD